MLNLNTIRENTIDSIKSSALDMLFKAGENKMYSYLSGNDINSTYTSKNVDNILKVSKKIDWSKIEDKSNALFSIGYSEQGNIIGILTNSNALLQDMLLYCDIEEAKANLTNILQIPVGSEKIIGKRYSVNGKSPLTFDLPVITKGGYKTLAVVINNAHANKFIEILKTLDIDALDYEDMLLLAKDISFISRTQELAIDVAKDKTIEIVNTSEWINMGVKYKNYWLSKNRLVGDWLAIENLNEIINAKKNDKDIPKFEITSNIPSMISEKVSYEVTTSESLAKEVLKQATEDFFNNTFKEFLTYAKETELSIESKALAVNSPLFKSFKQVLMAYRNYMIDNIPKNDIKDDETRMLLNKLYKQKTTKFASICRNTLYKIGYKFGYKPKEIAQITYGVDLLEVSVDEGKFFRAIMPEEFKLLYANGNKEKIEETLFYVDELTQDDILDGEIITVDFVNGKAYLNNILIAKTTYKFNETNCNIIFNEDTGRFIAVKEKNMELPPIGKEILVRCDLTDNINKKDLIGKSLNFFTVDENNNKNSISISYDNNLSEIIGSLGYNNYLDRYMATTLINSNILNTFAKKAELEKIDMLLSDFDYIIKYNLFNQLNIVDIITTNKDNEYKTDYLIISL